MQDPRLLILCATEFEVAGFLDDFSIEKETLRSGGGLFKGPEWHCLITGPGGFNTALFLGAYLERYTPELILDTGIAGAFETAGLKIGDIAVAERELYLHTGVGNDVFSRSSLPFELVPDCPASTRGMYNFDPGRVGRWLTRLTQFIDTGAGLEQDAVPEIKAGPFLTVSAITEGSEMAEKLYGRFSTVMESMEGAAAAHCAACCGIPLVEIRAASNLVGDRDKSRWNFPLACDRVRLICRTALASDYLI